MPHRTQLNGSVVRSLQTVFVHAAALHAVSPPEHVHAPPIHGPPTQTLPQPPQLLGSVEVSVQLGTPPSKGVQRVCPPEQALQLPATQTCPEPKHGLQLAPQ